MSAATAHPLPGRSAPAWGAGRIIALVGGSLLALIALGLALAGVMLILAHGTGRDSAGFYTSDTEHFSTPTYALTSEGLQIGDVHGDGAGWALDALNATVRVRASNPSGDPIFIGIAREQAVDRFLIQSAHEEVSDVHSGPFSYDSVRRGGSAAPGVPANATFWAATAAGPGTQALTWKPDARRRVRPARRGRCGAAPRSRRSRGTSRRAGSARATRARSRRDRAPRHTRRSPRRQRLGCG
jgi:hypothetical protein